KAAIRVASFNMNGWKAANAPKPKWHEINQMMREKRIGILLVQEAHLNEERRQEIEKLFKKSLKIYHSEDPTKPLSTNGVAIVLNRRLTNVNGVQITEVVKGRAIHIRTNWHREEKINILGVYAPNDNAKNAEFWGDIGRYYDTHPNVVKPDLMGGDFNLVEDAIDRLPMSEDDYPQVAALDDLKRKLNMKDGWRDTYPTTKAYTHIQLGKGSHGRIDRIYVTPKVLATAREWKIETVAVVSDHKMVSVQVASENAPDVAKGRWAIPKNLVRDRTLAKFINERGRDAISQADTMGPRTEEHNVQTIYASFKRESLEMARHREKSAVPKIELKLRELEVTLGKAENDTGMPEDDRAKAVTEISAKIANLERERHLKIRSTVATKNRLEGETICAHWCQSNKVAKPRDMIYALRKPAEPGADANTPAQYEKNSQKMAEMARDYHEKLQNDDDPPQEEIREEKIKTVLENIDAVPTEDQTEMMKRQLLEADGAEALKLSQNNKAAGLDGATYELWKVIHERYLEDVRCNRPAFNLIALMTRTFNDIESFGVISSTNFSEGWMCPIYKKNDRNEIANYRPITLLNTDYKIMTKALAMKL
ncbi:Endonuclease/exonuclease/phosphatase, partial [Mycena galopus ATCC 62051]